MSKETKKAKRVVGYSHSFACYGMPLSISVKVTRHFDVLREGNRKRHCRECLDSAVDCFREELRATVADMFARERGRQ